MSPSKLTNNDGAVVEERHDGSGEVCVAGGLRRDVKVDDDNVFFRELYFDERSFGVVGKRRSQFDKGDGVLDKREETPPTPSRTVSSDACIVWEIGRLGRLGQLSFLYASDLHLSSLKKTCQFRGRISNPIAIPVEDADRSRRGRRCWTGVWSDVADEKEN